MENNIYEVYNRSNSVVAYSIPDLDIYRTFQPFETKKISKEELEKLQYVEGGEYLMKNYLFIKDPVAIEELEIKTEPEYFYTQNEVKILLTTGTLDQLSDCLDFAPQGVIDLIKTMSVSLPLNDMAKANLIEEKLGFNVLNAIENSKDAEIETPVASKTRKAPPVTANKADTPKRSAPPVNTSK